MRELIARYEPSVLWNDISWPADEDELFRLFADYYAAVPDGVVNDRWVRSSTRLRDKAARAALDDRIKARIARLIPPPSTAASSRSRSRIATSAHRNTPASPTSSRRSGKPRAPLSHSFGFNRNDREADHTPARDPDRRLPVDEVSKNGRPAAQCGADGRPRTIPEPQVERLKAFGAWLGANGSAIYGAKPWRQAEAVTDTGLAVRITETPGAVKLHDRARRTGRPSGWWWSRAWRWTARRG